VPEFLLVVAQTAQVVPERREHENRVRMAATTGQKQGALVAGNRVQSAIRRRLRLAGPAVAGRAAQGARPLPHQGRTDVMAFSGAAKLPAEDAAESKTVPFAHRRVAALTLVDAHEADGNLREGQAVGKRMRGESSG